MDQVLQPSALEGKQANHGVTSSLLLRLKQRLAPSNERMPNRTADSTAEDPVTLRSSPKRQSHHGKPTQISPGYNHAGGLSTIQDTPEQTMKLSKKATPRTQSISTQQSRKSSETSLLNLPRELRDMIFEWVYNDWSGNNKSLGLLRTCRQLHYEGGSIAYKNTLFRLYTEHWPDHDYFRARHVSRIMPDVQKTIRHLALRLPRGMPHDRYASAALHTDLADLGFQLKSLIVFSHMARPLPHISVYGGVLEASFCTWLKLTLYAMPTLKHICILNYESATPTLHDMPSPRLIRMLRSSIFEDVMADCETWSEQNFEWRCLTDSLESSMSNCTADEKTYHIYSSKLGRSVEIVFRSEKFLPEYGLAHIVVHPEVESCLPASLREPMINFDCPVRTLAQKGSIAWSKRRPGEQILRRSWSRRSRGADAPRRLGSETMTRMRTLGRRLTLSQ